MPDPVSTIRHTLMLRRVDPERGMARYYALMIEQDLFGTVCLVRRWGRIGARRGSEMAEEFTTEVEAAEALVRIAEAKRRRGYRDL